MDDKTKFENFKTELKELLEKYDACIDLTLGEGSDTHGIYGEHFEVAFYKRNEKGFRTWSPETFTLADGMALDASDL